MSERDRATVKYILKYLNSNKNYYSSTFVRFIYQFSKKKCSTLITLRRDSYLNQLHTDTIPIFELFEFILFGNKSDRISTARLANAEEIEIYNAENRS